MGKGICSINNLKKTVRYLKKNGISHAYYAVRERIEEEKKEHYHYAEPSGTVLEAQRRESATCQYLFSIVVPAYETKEEFLREMIDSVRRQSYAKWELVIVDAGSSDAVERIVGQILKETGETRIRYRHLWDNKGIAGNTNEGIGMASGDYIALLDHDDFLTPDALYHMAQAVQDKKRQGTMPALLYSDEDKYENSGRYYTDLHRKCGFNLDLILSNNYICHFTAVEANLMKSLYLRGRYDGAQDYDLVLRVVDSLWKRVPVSALENFVVHIPKVLYHWRVHEESTAGNTASKTYAYEAGKEALADFCAGRGWDVEVAHSLHLGFYEISYKPALMKVRPEVGIVGGRLLDRQRRICAGAYREDGACMYEGLHKEYSGGRTHRAVLKQDVSAVDIRCMQVGSALRPVFEEITGLPYREKTIRCKNRSGEAEQQIADVSGLCCDEAGYRKLSMELGRAARQMGYLVLWDPAITCEMNKC